MLTAMIVDDEASSRRLLREYCAAEPDVQILGEYADGRSALPAVETTRPDALFLDIEMDALDGMTLVRALEMSRPPVVVFVTAHVHYAAEAFELSAADYLLKPFDVARFHDTVERVRWRLRAERSAARQEALEAALEHLQRARAARVARRTRLLVGTGSDRQVLDAEQIEAACTERNYVKINVGSETHILRATLRAAQQALCSQPLLRVSRSCLVNFNHVRRISRTRRGDYILVLTGGATVTSAEGYREAVRLHLERYTVGWRAPRSAEIAGGSAERGGIGAPDCPGEHAGKQYPGHIGQQQCAGHAADAPERGHGDGEQYREQHDPDEGRRPEVQPEEQP